MGKDDQTGIDNPAVFQQPGAGAAPYYGGPGGAQPGQPQVVTQTVIMHMPEFGSDPMQAMCHTCQRTVTTNTKKSFNLICCLLFGCWACCCSPCQDVEHYCPNCKALLGKHKAV